jgi:hypothetical protein
MVVNDYINPKSAVVFVVVLVIVTAIAKYIIDSYTENPDESFGKNLGYGIIVGIFFAVCAVLLSSKWIKQSNSFGMLTEPFPKY